MNEVNLRLITLVAILVAVGLLIWWLSARSRKNKHAKHIGKLNAIAGPSGGRVVTEESESVPRSATLRPIFPWLSRRPHNEIVRPPNYQHAMSLWRGRWYVRVAQASAQKTSKSPTTSGRTVSLNAYRIEIELAPCPPLKLSPVVQLPGVGKQVVVPADDELPEPPNAGGQSAQPNPGEWRQMQLPVPHSERLHVFAADHQFAASVLNDASLEWLVTHLPGLRALLNIEQGLLHINMSDTIDTNTILDEIDVLIGFLDRTPIEPPHPNPA